MGIVRLFLAWVVAADHWRILILVPRSIPVDDQIKFGFNAGYAVMFFYVISGFLITYTLARNYERDLSGALSFYRNRFIRIFSLYWPLVIVSFVLIDFAWEWFVSAGLADKLTGIFLLGMDWRIAFASYPQTHNRAAINGLGQAWTLGAELAFYVIAPLLMRSWKIGAVLLVASLAVRMAFVIASGPDLQYVWTYLFFPSTVCFFMLGHLICLASRRWSVLGNPALGVALLVCSFALMTLGSYKDFDTLRFWSSILCFTFAVPGLFEATKSIRWMNAVGDLSYPVYLVHYIVLILGGAALAEIMLPLGSPYWSIAASLVVVTAVAAVVHRGVEIPVAHVMRRISARPFVRA